MCFFSEWTIHFFSFDSSSDQSAFPLYLTIVNMYCTFFLHEHMLCFLFHALLGNELLDNTAILCLSAQGSQLSVKYGFLMLLSHFLIGSSALIIFCLFNYGHSSHYKVISNCFDMHFSNDYWGWAAVMGMVPICMSS